MYNPGTDLMGTLSQMNAPQPQQGGAQAKPTAYGVPGIQAPLQFDNHQTLQSAPSPSSIGSAVVKAAKNFLGVPYKWGGESAKGFDCSGLMQYIFKQQGVNIPRVTYDQIKQGTAVQQNNMQAGDLVFFKEPNGSPGHVGVYIGNGQIIHAPHTGDVVRVAQLSTMGMPIAGIRRFGK
jgi:cell wall-associated NlpC family hydrolase